MQRPPLVQTPSRLAAVGFILMVLLLLIGAGTAAAAEDEEPSNVIAYPNAPGWITVTWQHSGDDVYGFVLEQESPFAFQQMDAGKRTWTVPGLEANRTYRYRVCAVYVYHRVCSGYAQATTLPPPPPPPRPSGGTSPPPRVAPKPLYSPVIRAAPARLLAGTPPVVHLRWVNPVDATQFALLTRMDWYRDGAYFNSSSTKPEIEDVVTSNHRYKLCVENPVNKICSPEIIAGPGGAAASFESVNFPKRYIRHRRSLGELTPVNNKLDSEDVAFFIRPGLSGAARSVSFESVNYPRHFLRHQGYRIKLHRDDGSDLFRKDATFVMRPGLRNLPDLVSFESVNYPGHFIRHQNFELWIVKNDGSDLFRLDATFRQTDHYIGHLQPPVPVQPTSPGTLKLLPRKQFPR